MTDHSVWRERAREVLQAAGLSNEPADRAEETTVIVQRLLALAAQCVGSPSALARHLGLPYSELATYLTSEVMPPEEVLLRALQLVIEHRKAVQ
jgi:hypothetical protein